MFLGAITVSYNLPGVKTGLKLDGKTIGDIFLGKVKTWNDAEIKALNPGVTLPSTAITVIHRSDSSGTTAGFTGFLAAVDPEFKSKVGEGKDVPWPTGTGAKGNAGVAGAVQQTDGAVGYVEQAYALQHNFTYASVKNKAGKFVAPTLASTSAAARRREGAGEPRASRSSTRRTPAPTRSPRRRSSSSTRTSARRAPPAAKQPPRASSKFIELRPRRRAGDPRPGRLRRAAGVDPGEVQGSRSRPAVQRRADRRLSADDGLPDQVDKHSWSAAAAAKR